MVGPSFCNIADVTVKNLMKLDQKDESLNKWKKAVIKDTEPKCNMCPVTEDKSVHSVCMCFVVSSKRPSSFDC